MEGNAAEVYEAQFLPALFLEWTPRVADAAGVRAGSRVLDVACGTGVVAREAAKRVGPSGSVTGLDRNPAMLAVARRKAPGIDWREGRAEELPFPDATFDAVTCQFGLMFFEDRARALREMRRVARPGGRVVAAVWDAIERQPDYPMVEVVERLVGKDVGDEWRAPYVLGDPDKLRRLFVDAGMPDAQVATVQGTQRYPSVDAFMEAMVKGWTFADRVDERQFAELVREARTRLAPFVQPDGRLVMPAPAHLATATRA